MTLAVAAEVVRLEPKYVSAFFKRATGTTFKRWLTSVRVDLAKQYLASGNRQITEVAFLVGFGDLRSLERAFERTTGMTPRQFKKAIRPEPIASNRT